MSHPWKSPVAPLPLNPAPAQHTTSRRGALRPPIFNPYDKFTRPQFDSWIGDITSALRKALRREEEPNKLKGDTSQVSDAPLRARETSEDEVSLSEGQNVGESTEKSGEESDEALEDSFAHLQSRNSKGKTKDTSEGRGSGNGDINQPIQILDESEEEEEEEEVNEEHSDEGGHRDSSEDFSDSYEEGGEEHPENVASTNKVIELVSSDEGDEEEGQEHNESDESEEFDAEQMIFNAQQKQDEDEDEEVESEIDDLPHAESDDQDDEAEEGMLHFLASICFSLTLYAPTQNFCQDPRQSSRSLKSSSRIHGKAHALMQKTSMPVGILLPLPLQGSPPITSRHST